MTAERPITHLRSVSLAVPHLERAHAFYSSKWGLATAAHDTGIAYLAATGSRELFSLRLREGQSRRVDMISFGARSAAHVDRLANRLGHAEVPLLHEPRSLDQPGGGYGMRFFTPDGTVIEVSSDMSYGPSREIEEREPIPRKISHVVMNTTNVPRLAQFLTEHLGLVISDWLADSMCFLRCNSDHHSIALHAAPHASLNHVSWEMRGVDEFMRATGGMIRHGDQMVWGPGRHGPGDNTFAYFVEPSGFVMEYTTALERIEDDREARVWGRSPETADQWGTAGTPPEQAVLALSGEEDPGLWVPPPV